MNDTMDTTWVQFLRDIEQVRSVAPKVARVELRSDDDGAGVLTGHFSVFNTWYEIDSWLEGNFLERVARGSFKRTFNAFRDSDDPHRIQVLLEHGFDPTVGDKPLGVPTTLEEDSTGARYDVDLFDADYVTQLTPAFRAGVYGASFRFRVLHDEWVKEPEESEHNPRGLPERTIREVRVAEFGPTVFPASPTATAGMRSATDEFYERLRSRDPNSVEQLLARAREIRTPEPPAGLALPEGTPDGPGPATPATDEPERSEVITVDPPARHSTAPPDDNKEAIVETMTVAERAARQSEIKGRLADIDNEHNGAVLPDDVKEEWDRLNNEYDQHEKAIAEDTERKDRLRALADDNPRTVAPGSVVAPFRTQPDKVRDPHDLAEIRGRARSVDELPQLYRDNAMRVVESARYGGSVSREDAQTQVQKLLDTIDDGHGTLARRILVTGSPTYERAFGKMLGSLSTAGLTPDEHRALSLADEKGGYAVPFALDPTVILTSDGALNPLRRISRVEQITTKTWQGVTSAGISVSRAPEASQVAEASPTFAQPEVTPQRVHGFIPFSIEIDQDWPTMRSEMTRLLQDAKDTEEATSFVQGDGSTGQQPGGIPGSITTAPPLIYTGASWDDEDVYGLETALPVRWRPRARFLANKATYQTIRQFADADGHDLWERIGAGQPPLLLGYPAEEASAMDDGSTDGHKFLVYGDFTQFLIVDRVGMSVELVPHLFHASNNRPTGQRGLYAIWRNDSKVLVPGAFRILVTGTE